MNTDPDDARAYAEGFLNVEDLSEWPALVNHIAGFRETMAGQPSDFTLTVPRHVYVCTACGRRITSIVPYVVADDEAWHDKGYDDIRQRVLAAGNVAATFPACGPLRAATPDERR